MRERRAPIHPVLLVVLLAGIACQISYTKRAVFFGEMEIDPNPMKVRLRDELSWLGPPSAPEYYFRFAVNNGRSTVDHFGNGGKVRYTAFFVNADNAFSTRSKYQVLLSGVFGTVYAESTCFYGPFYNGQSTQFFSTLYLNEVGSEPLQLVSALPTDEMRRLSAISVIRVFQAPPEFLVVSANYAPDGRLGRVFT